VQKLSAQVVAISRSRRKGTPKGNVAQARLIPEHGLEGDAHAGPGHRQVSLLAEESIAKMVEKGLAVHPGSFAENITTRGVDLTGLPVGTVLALGEEARLEVTQIGKECHTRCAIYERAGDCVMPREGIFAKVIRGGLLRRGDLLTVEGKTKGGD
jgi:MOSC domain-containing protein YiiM